MIITILEFLVNAGKVAGVFLVCAIVSAVVTMRKEEKEWERVFQEEREKEWRRQEWLLDRPECSEIARSKKQ